MLRQISTVNESQSEFASPWTSFRNHILCFPMRYFSIFNEIASTVFNQSICYNNVSTILCASFGRVALTFSIFDVAGTLFSPEMTFNFLLAASTSLKSGKKSYFSRVADNVQWTSSACVLWLWVETHLWAFEIIEGPAGWGDRNPISDLITHIQNKNYCS